MNQQWPVVGGQTASANRSDGQTYCLDVHFGNHNFGTSLGVAPCNGTAAQVFWTAGPSMKLGSMFSHLTANPSLSHAECLDVLFDNEVVGASLDDSDCNGSNAQWFVLDTQHRISLANNPSQIGG